MGQYYKICRLASKKKNYPNKEKVVEYLSSYDYGNGAKLMEFSWKDNRFVGALENLINKENGSWAGSPIIVAGWSKDDILKEEKKYKTRRKFQEGCATAYQIARKNGWLDEMTWFEIKYHNWNLDSIIEESKRYHSRNDFKKNNRGAYCTALKNGWMDIIFQKVVEKHEEKFVKNSLS